MTEERPSAAILPFRRWPKSRTYRQRIVDALEWLEDHREHLVRELDEIDGDPDLEENGDLEPSLGFTECSPKPGVVSPQGSNLADGGSDDREAEHDGREPSLGFSEPMIPATPICSPRVSQLRLWEGARDDREDEHDGREIAPTQAQVEDCLIGPVRRARAPQGTPDDPLPVFRGPLLWSKG